MSAENVVKTRILQRRGTEASWNSENPVLSSGELIFVTTDDGTFCKLGNGQTYKNTDFISNIKIDEDRISSMGFLHISQAEYDQLVIEGEVDPNTLYLVSSDNFDVKGERIVNMSEGTDISDAVNFGQLSSTASELSSYARQTAAEALSSLSSSVTLSSANSLSVITKLVLADGLSVQGRALVEGDIASLTADLRSLSSDISTKVYIKNPETQLSGGDYSDLSVIKVTNDEYFAISSHDPRTVYIVSSDILNMRGERIVNLLDGEHLSDAVNLGQLNAAVGQASAAASKAVREISGTTQLSSPNGISVITKLSQVSGVVGVESRALGMGDIAGLEADLGTLSDMISTKVYIKNPETQLSGGDYSDLSVVKTTYDDYFSLSSYDPKTIYLVSSDNFNMMGERIVNLADGVDLSDAVNLGQLNAMMARVFQLEGMLSSANARIDQLSALVVSANALLEEMV